MVDGIRQGSAELDGLHVEWLEMGEGPLAICLHGFPDSAHTWRHLLPALAEAGYRGVAPWTRGYEPTGVAPDGLYQAGVRGRDVCLLHEHLGGDGDAAIIGHDWGSGAANIAAVKEPDRWSSAVLMAVPPTGRVGAAFFDYTQLRRSSYMFFFQHPLSEAIVPHDDWAFITGLWNDWSPGYDAEDDVRNFVAASSGEGRLAATLGYYRATFQPDLVSDQWAEWDQAQASVPPQPTLYIHGRNDGCIGVEVADGLADDLSDGSRVLIVDDAGHFAHLEQPELINSAITQFLTR